MKVITDHLDKWLFHRNSLPMEVYEMRKYFRNYGAIGFKLDKQEDGTLVVYSVNYKYGSIITSASNEVELDREIKDAILTSFSVPSAYAKDAKVFREGSEVLQYATVK